LKQHGTDFNIISPLADLDLNDFLTGNYPGFSTRIENEGFTPQHLLQEAACLAGALNYLHQGLEIRGRGGYMACAHMDLKPDNILVSWRPPDGPELAVGQWMIHDFGTSRIKESNRMPQTHLAPGDFLREMSLTKSQRQPGPFQAPEVQNDTEKTCGRESDCWSFGCILTVILAFALGGPEMVDDLFQCIDNGVDDYFYTVEGDRKILKPQVLQWLDRLKVGPSEHVWVRKYKHVIMALLKIAPEERLKAQVVRDELNKISRDGGESLQARCTSRWPSRTLISPPSPLRITPRTESANPPHASPATPRHRGHLPTLIVTSRDDSQSSVSASSADQHSLARPPLESDTSITSDELARLLGGSTLGPMTRARFSLASQPAASIFMRLETPGSSFTSRLAPSCERVLFLSRSAAKLYHIDLLESHNDWAAKRDARLIKSATVANCHREIVCERGREWTYAGIAGPFVALISRAKDSKQLKAS
jgi:serine/threonine protein kinase